MMQQQQQVRSIIKFSTPANEGRHQQHNGPNNTDSSKPQRFQNGGHSSKKSNWKSHATQSVEKPHPVVNNNQRNLWELNKTSSLGITSPTSSQDSLSTIWFTPPQSHSPASSAGGDLGLTSTPLKFEPQQQVGRMIRAQDLSSGKEANIWSSPPPQLPPNSVHGATTAVAGPQPPMRNTNTSFDGAKSSNACLQLFSDNFMSYLNMIN